MRVAMVNLTSGGLSGGYRKYLRHLLPELTDDSRVSDLVAFLPQQAQTLGEGLVPEARYWPRNDPARGFSWLKAQVDAFTADVVFVPTARWLDFDQRPTVVMVRNMEPLVVPIHGNGLLEGFRNLARARAARKACRRADRVLAVSRFVQDYLLQRWRIARQKVGIVYHGVEPPPSLGDSPLPKALKGRRMAPFLFTAGSIRPARGLEDVLGALALLQNEGGGRTLVVAGAADTATRAYGDRLRQIAEEQGIGSRIVWAGHLSSGEMSWCFDNCEAFVMTSRVEACPNIALEAMSHGALCVSGDNPPMPEFFQDVARYYQSGDAGSLASVLTEVFALDQAEHRDSRRRSRQRAAEFTWAKTARRTVEELAMACGQAAR